MLQHKLPHLARYFGQSCRLFSLSKHPSNTLFTKNHEWLRPEGPIVNGKQLAKVGITDYSQRALGDIVFVELPRVGSLYHKDGNLLFRFVIIIFLSIDPLAVVESAKGATDIYAPITGKIVKANSLVAQKPSLINKHAESDGWICEIECEHDQLEAEVKASHHLLSQEGYEKFCKTGA